MNGEKRAISYTTTSIKAGEDSWSKEELPLRMLLAKTSADRDASRITGVLQLC